MNSPQLKKKPLRNVVSALMDELNMSSPGTLLTSSNLNTISGNEDKANRNILHFKMNYLVGRTSSIDNAGAPLPFFSRAALQVKSPDLTCDLLKKVNKRKENIHLNTEFNTPSNSHQMEEKKKQIVALLSKGKYSKTKPISNQNKILRSLEVMKMKLHSNNHLVQRG